MERQDQDSRGSAIREAPRQSLWPALPQLANARCPAAQQEPSYPSQPDVHLIRLQPCSRLSGLEEAKPIRIFDRDLEHALERLPNQGNANLIELDQRLKMTGARIPFGLPFRIVSHRCSRCC